MSTHAKRQYIGSTNNTVPFNKAEKPVLDALGLINDRRRLLSPNFIPFNELLTAGYMDDQKMSVSEEYPSGEKLLHSPVVPQ